jgi:hypothetical protein
MQASRFGMQERPLPLSRAEADLQAVFTIKGRDARHVFNTPFGELIR